MIQIQDIKRSNVIIMNDITYDLLNSRLKKINWNKTILKRNLRALVKERKLLIPEEHFFWINGLLSIGVLSYRKQSINPKKMFFWNKNIFFGLMDCFL